MAETLKTGAQKKETVEKLKEGRIEVIEVKVTTFKILEEKFVATSSSCCEQYRKGSHVVSHGSAGLGSQSISRRSSRKR